MRSHSLVARAVFLGSLSCWKIQPQPIFNALTEGRRLFMIHGPSILPSIRCSRPVPFAEKHPQRMMFPLQGRDGVLGIVLIEFIPKSYILVSADHMTFSHASSGSSRWSLANFRWAWTCAGLSRGTLRALQGFNP